MQELREEMDYDGWGFHHRFVRLDILEASKIGPSVAYNNSARLYIRKIVPRGTHCGKGVSGAFLIGIQIMVTKVFIIFFFFACLGRWIAFCVVVVVC